MKTQVKKSLEQGKVEQDKTGGYSCVAGVDEKLVKILGNQAITLMKPFDSDSDYHDASGITHWFYFTLNIVYRQMLLQNSFHYAF